MNYHFIYPAAGPTGFLEVRDLRNAFGAAVPERAFVRGQRSDVPTPLVYRRGSGVPQDWTWGPELMPFVRARVGQRLQAEFPDDVELLPLTVAGSTEAFHLLNCLSIRDCVDEARSLAEREPSLPGSGGAPGPFRSVGFLTVDESRVGDADFFRVAGWELTLIVSDRFAKLARQERWTGLELQRTYDGPPADFRPRTALPGNQP